MFETEAELQQLVHDNPGLILNGILEINPAYCSDTPGLLSLGREVRLSSGSVDNLFIDVNGIITLVECKRYSDSRIKREVYSQVIDYASNLQSTFIHYSGDEFIEQFYSLVLKGQAVKSPDFPSIVDALSEDPLLIGKNISDWKKQFYQRFEYNIKNGVFRIVILCVPSPTTSFACTAIRNLMQLMTFVESTNSKYDIILMDLRHGSGNYQSQIIWRRYCQLPQIPLLAQSSRNTALGIEAMKERFSRLSSDAKSSLEIFLNSLDDAGIYSVENTLGYALNDVNTRKSMYISVEDIKDNWKIVRHQIRKGEILFENIKNESFLARLNSVTHNILEKLTGKGEPMYYIVLYPDNHTDINELINFLKSCLSYRPLAD